MPPLVQLRNVSKRFGGVRALENVSLDLSVGKVHCLAGENGSGKSTLIKILAGVYRPDSGTITIDGEHFQRLTPIDSVRHGVQVIYQDFSLFPNLSVLENLALNNQLEHGAKLVSRRRMLHTATEAIERLGVRLPLDVAVEQLPVAQKQLVAIARALVQVATVSTGDSPGRDARLIILDEPTTALTHVEVERLFEIVRNLKERGVAILFVSHKLREMQLISDRFTILRNGQIAAEGPADDFTAARIAECMIGHSIDERRHMRPGAPEGQTVLKAEHLTGSLINDVSLSLAAGQIVGLTGLLGSGQTELALALFGLKPCESGRITVEGFPRPIRNVRDALAAGIAYVPEDRLTEGLFLEQSIQDNLLASNVEPVRTDAGLISPKRARQHADYWLRELAIQAEDCSAAMITLSGGNQQRVVLAKWLSRRPRVLILNGPTVGVDVGSKEKLHQKLKELATQGMAILMISDDLRELAHHCDSVLVIHRGKIVDELASDDLSEDTVANTLNALE